MTPMTSYGQDIDNFIATYIPENRKELAMAELQLIVVKAQRAMLIEMRQTAFPSK